ncbi:MAG: DnaD domain protein [Kiritimatiellia bacterium]
MENGISVVFGRRRMPSLDIPGELFFCYQPLLGSQAILVWLNLRWLLEIGMEGDAEAIIQQQMGINFKQLTTALQRLQEADLLELGAAGQYILNEPLSVEAFTACFGALSASASVTAHKEAAASAVGVGSAANTTAAADIAATAEPEIASAPASASAPAPAPAPTPAPAPGPNPEFELTGAAKQGSPAHTAHTAHTVTATAVTAGDTPVASVAPAAKNAPPVNARAELARHKEASAKPEGEGAASAASSGRRQTAKTGEKSKRANQRDSLSADMQAVMQIYEKKMGVFGPSHFEKLRYWVEEMHMEGEVVAAAIEDAARQPRTRRLSYIEGILRNWHNEGIHTLRDALKANASRVLAGDAHGDATGSNKPMEGVANAGAYKHVDPKLVQKWKELYPDEYSS